MAFTPTNGTPVPNVSGITGAANGQQVQTQEKSNYGSWDGDWLGYLTYMADNGDEASRDRLFNYLTSESSAQTARDWTAKREDTQYQRFVEDVRKAGINPIALLSMAGGSPISSASSGHSYNGSQYTSYATKSESNEIMAQKIGIGAVVGILGALIAALL